MLTVIVDDNVVLELVKAQVEYFEKDHTSWIIEGFPRTKSQALALQKQGIIPDRFIMLDVDKDEQIKKIRANLLLQSHRPGAETDAIAIKA
jgi:adenylate kinase